MIFFSCRDGTLAIIHEDSPDKYTLVETVKTKAGSKTMALDLKTHKVFLPSAELKGGKPQPKTFEVLIFGK